MQNPKHTTIVKGSGGGWIAIAILIIAFDGEPDLLDSLIHYLTGIPLEEIQE